MTTVGAPVRPKLDVDDEDIVPPILEEPKLTGAVEVPIRELFLRSRDASEDVALEGRPAAAPAPVEVSEEEERAEARPWL